MTDNVEIQDNHLVVKDREMLAKMAVRSLMSAPYDIFMEDLIEYDGSLIGKALTLRIDVGDFESVKKYQLAIGGLPSCVTASGQGILSIQSASSIRRLVELGFDTGVNDELFPDLAKSKVDPSRFK